MSATLKDVLSAQAKLLAFLRERMDKEQVKDCSKLIAGYTAAHVRHDRATRTKKSEMVEMMEAFFTPRGRRSS